MPCLLNLLSLGLVQYAILLTFMPGKQTRDEGSHQNSSSLVGRESFLKFSTTVEESWIRLTVTSHEK